MNRQRHNSSPHGFTLLELVVALFMVAVLSISLAATIQVAFGNKAAAEKAVEPPRTAELAMELLRADLENAQEQTSTATTSMMASYEATTNLAGCFEAGAGGTTGSDADIIFFTTADSPDHVDANGEIKVVELTTEPDPNNAGQSVLVRRVVRNLLSETAVNPDEEVVCRNVTSFTALYFDGSNWNTSWDASQLDSTAPAAVEIELSIQRPGGTGQGMRTLNYTRVFPVASSTAAQDSNVNTGVAVQ